MQPVKAITVTDGIGREVNPSPEFDPVGLGINIGWTLFEKTVKSYPCPELSNTKPGETVEAELVYQYDRRSESTPVWIDCSKEDYEKYNRHNERVSIWDSTPTRQIYRLVPKEEKPDILKRIDKIEETVLELVTLVNELSIAVRKRFDRLTPPTLK